MKEVSLLMEQILQEIHKRTPKELVIKDNALIIGAGGVGTWVALLYTLSSAPDAKLHIIDDDVLEMHNLNRLPYPLLAALDRMPKAKVLAEYLRWLRPYLQINYYLDRIDSEEKLLAYVNWLSPEVIIDATDNLSSQKIIRRVAMKYNIPLLAVHYDGTHGTIEWIPSKYHLPADWVVDENASGYQVFPSVAFVPAFLASIAVAIIAIKPRRYIFWTFDFKEALTR